ncbi:hypothetical protein EBR77_04675 [bacterium]|nr:hypothetical protein [bacterium]
MQSPSVPSQFNATDFTDLSNCFQNCANAHGIDIERLDDIFSESKICDTLKSNQKAIDFVKCYIDKCNIDDLAITFKNIRVDDSRMDDSRSFNCPGLDPSVIFGGGGGASGDQPVVKINSMAVSIHQGSALGIALFALFFL